MSDYPKVGQKFIAPEFQVAGKTMSKLTRGLVDAIEWNERTYGDRPSIEEMGELCRLARIGLCFDYVSAEDCRLVRDTIRYRSLSDVSDTEEMRAAVDVGSALGAVESLLRESEKGGGT